MHCIRRMNIMEYSIITKGSKPSHTSTSIFLNRFFMSKRFAGKTIFQITGIAPVICFLMLMGSCNLYKEVEVTELTQVQIGDISEEGVQVEIHMQVKNPNGYSVALTKSQVDVCIEGNRLGELELAEKIKIQKN